MATKNAISPPTQSFVGREKEIEELSEIFEEKSNIAVVVGKDGNGKREFVKEYCNVYHDSYDFIITLQDVTYSVEQLSTKITNTYKSSIPLFDFLEQSKKKWLIVISDIPNDDENLFLKRISRFLSLNPQKKDHHVIFIKTTPFKYLNYPTITVEPLPETDSKKLFKKLLTKEVYDKLSESSNPNHIETLLNLSNNIPLYITLISNYINATTSKTLTPEQIISNFGNKESFNIVNLILQEIKTQVIIPHELFNIMIWFSNLEINKDWIYNLEKSLPTTISLRMDSSNDNSSSSNSKQNISKFLNLLETFGLIKVHNGNAFQFHIEVQRTIREQQSTFKSNYYNQFIQCVVTLGESIKVPLEVDLLYRHLNDFIDNSKFNEIEKDSPSSKYTLALTACAEGLMVLPRYYSDAIDYSKEAITILESIKPMDLNTLGLLSRTTKMLGLLYGNILDFDSAIDQLKKSDKFYEKFYENKTNIEKSNILLHIGFQYLKKEDLEESIKYFQQSMESNTQKETSIIYAKAMYNAALCYSNLALKQDPEDENNENIKKSIYYFKKSSLLLKKLAGEDSSYTLSGYLFLAKAYVTNNQFQKANEIMNGLRKILEKNNERDVLTACQQEFQQHIKSHYQKHPNKNQQLITTNTKILLSSSLLLGAGLILFNLYKK